MANVAEELPFVAVVNDDKLDTVCSNCFAVKSDLNKINLKKCSKCAIVHYCSNKCQKEDWIFHKDECQFIKGIKPFVPHIIRFIGRIAMRVKRGDLPVAFNGRTFDDLMDHKEDISKDVKLHVKMALTYQCLIEFLPRDNLPSFREFRTFYGKHNANSIPIQHMTVYTLIEDIGIGLYLGIAAHNHSCRPNSDFHFNGSKIILRANDPNAEYSKDLTIPYINRFDPKEIRQKDLRTRCFFDCDCDRCMDEEIELWERSGKSSCCPENGAVLPVHKKFLWYWEQPLVCTNCGKKADICLKQIEISNNCLVEICANKGPLLHSVPSKKDLEKYMKLLEAMECLLSPYNLYLLKFTRLVVSLELFTKNGTVEPKYMQALLKQIEKYSIRTSQDVVIDAIFSLKAVTFMKCNMSRGIAFAKIDTAVQKALDVVKESYGSEHPLYKEIEQFSAVRKLEFDKKKAAKGRGNY